jgi:glycerate kinase
MKIIVAPDKFKGSLDSFEICEAVREGLARANRDLNIITFPMADGGDGFGNIVKHYMQTESVACKTVDALGRAIDSGYEWDPRNRRAIIEMALASGLYLLKDNERDPMLTSTFGTGVLVKDAIEKGALSIILGLGGSATNDAGTGILAALGFTFLNADDDPLEPCGRSLGEIKKIKQPSHLPAIKFELACDVKNVLYGPTGAAHVYAPQKGANAQQVMALDEGLKNFAQLLVKETGKDVATIPGAGAAGGIAAGLIPFFDVELKSGIEMIIDASNLKNEMPTAQLLITGEGRIDTQSGTGKVVGYMASLAASYNVPCHAICGEATLDVDGLKNLGLQRTVSLTGPSVTREQAVKDARKLIVEKIGGLLDGL